MYRITNISSSQVGVEGALLAPSGYLDIQKLSSVVTNLALQNIVTIEDLRDAGEDATIAIEGSLNAGGDALSVVNLEGTDLTVTNPTDVGLEVVNLAGTGLSVKNYSPANASGTVADATPVVVDASGLSWPRNIWVNPSSATVRVEVSENGGATYVAWPLGDVTVPTNDIRYEPCSHIRFSRISGTSFTYGIN